MSNTRKRVLCIMVVSVGIACGLSLSDDFMVTGPRLVKSAQAYIGNPLTPMSFAGVARRSARRTYFYGGGYPMVPILPMAAILPMVPIPMAVAIPTIGHILKRTFARWSRRAAVTSFGKSDRKDAAGFANEWIS